MRMSSKCPSSAVSRPVLYCPIASSPHRLIAMAAVDVQHPVETTYVPAPRRDLPMWAMANGRPTEQWLLYKALLVDDDMILLALLANKNCRCSGSSSRN